MNIILRKILIYTVLVVLLLHTFIPHLHSGEMTDKEHIELHNNSNTLYGFLSIVFHECNDESLDNLKSVDFDIVLKTKNKYLYPRAAIKTNIQSAIKIIANCNSYILNKLIFDKLNDVRGPPIKPQHLRISLYN